MSNYPRYVSQVKINISVSLYIFARALHIYNIIMFSIFFRCSYCCLWTHILNECFYFFLFNTGNRIEDFFYEKIDKKKPNRLTNSEYVGIDMIEAGNEFGPGTSYGMMMYFFFSLSNFLHLK